MKMLINGSFCDASDGKTQPVYNPYTGEAIDTIPLATPDDVSAAIGSATKGFGEWSATPLHKRVAALKRFAALALERREELAALVAREMGRPISETRNDPVNMAAIFTGYAEAAPNFLGQTMPIGGMAGKERDVELLFREPLGVIACIVPFNAPLALFSYKAAPALAAGNSIVVKPASDAPLAILCAAGLMAEAGIPAEAIQFVTGSGSKVGRYITSDARVSRVSFTGSTEVGISIYSGAASNLTHVSLELGGNAPFVLAEDGDVRVAAREAFAGRTTLTGQVCNVSKRFIIHKTLKEEFISELKAHLDSLVYGDPLDERTTFGTLISEEAAKTVELQVQHTIDQGARLIRGGERSGAFYEPAILDCASPDLDIMRDMEVFGPVFPIVAYDTLDEAIAIANNTRYGLGASIFTESTRTAVNYISRVQAGSVIVNGNSYYRSLLMPFGGYKHSGIGNEGLFTALQEVTRMKSVVFKGVMP